MVHPRNNVISKIFHLLFLAFSCIFSLTALVVEHTMRPPLSESIQDRVMEIMHAKVLKAISSHTRTAARVTGKLNDDKRVERCHSKM